MVFPFNRSVQRPEANERLLDQSGEPAQISERKPVSAPTVADFALVAFAVTSVTETETGRSASPPETSREVTQNQSPGIAKITVPASLSRPGLRPSHPAVFIRTGLPLASIDVEFQSSLLPVELSLNRITSVGLESTALPSARTTNTLLPSGNVFPPAPTIVHAAVGVFCDCTAFVLILSSSACAPAAITKPKLIPKTLFKIPCRMLRSSHC